MSSNAAVITRTFSDQVIGFYKEINLDPVSTVDVLFDIEFNSSYSTICVERIECHRISRTEDGYDTFQADKEAALLQVRPHHEASWMKSKWHHFLPNAGYLVHPERDLGV